VKLLHFLRRGEVFAALLVTLSIASFAGLAFLGDGEKVRAALARVDAGLVASIAALALVNYVLRAWRFQIFARRLGMQVPFPSMLLYYIAGFAMSVTPGKLGELVRLWLIRRRHGYSVERGFPLQIADRANDVVASMILCIAAIGAFSGYWLVVLSGAAVLALGVAALMRPKLLVAAIGLVYRAVGRRARLFARVRRMLRRTSLLFAPQVFLPTLVLGVIGWSAECLAFDLCLHAVAGAEGLGRSTFIFTFANLAGGLTFLPGGVGSTELTFMGMLMSAGVGFEEAATVTAVIRGATLWFGVLLGVAAMTVVLRASRELSHGAFPAHREDVMPPKEAELNMRAPPREASTGPA
jgi:uncharacterized protein (TIRG00374 family)